MPKPINSKITPSLHPDNIKSLKGYSDTTRSYVAPLETAFSLAYQSLEAVYEAKDKAKANTAWTPATQILRTADLANKYQEKVLRSFDNVRANLESAVLALNEDLSAPFKQKPETSGVAGEIRAHAKSLSMTERTELIQSAIQSGDNETTSAILGAPNYLSGLNGAEQAMFTRSYHESTKPDIVERLSVMQAGLDLLDSRAGLVFQQFEQALGADSAKVNRLRAADNDAEKAFIMKDFDTAS